MSVMANWDQYALNNMGNGSTTSLGTTYMTGRTDMKYTVSATRLNDQLFLLTSLGSRVDPSGAELARSSVATLARLSFVSATAKAAVTVTKPVKFNGNAFSVIGNDSLPKGWDKDSLGNADPNCTKGADQAGIRSADHDRRRQRRPGQPLRQPEGGRPTTRPSPATSSTSSAT